MLKSIHELTNQELDSIIQNVNTGIEFELAVYYHLSSVNEKEKINIKIISRHPLRDKINDVIANLDSYNLKKDMSMVNEPEFSYLTTQDDSVGPSDVVIKVNNELIGLSIKYSNNCNLNISGSHFLSEESISDIQHSYDFYGKNYISEMIKLYGPAENWFRQRKSSEVVNEIIDLIRDKVIYDWSFYLTDEGKMKIINLAFHSQSPIKFYIARIDKIRGVYKCSLDKNPVKQVLISEVKLKKYQTSYIAFSYRDEVFALMQIKFNNGILEKPKGNVFNYEVDGIKMKFGSPLTSWNFNLQ
jgi:hypothetical protein